MRRLSFRLVFVVCLTATSLQACGGGGGSTPAPSLSNAANTGGGTSQQLSSATASSPSVSGTISAAATNQITVASGPACGNVNVTYNTSTQLYQNGLTMGPGSYASVYGTGSCSSISATKIVLSASTAAVSGTISNVGSTTINLNAGGSCGYVNVSYGSGTAIYLNGYTLGSGTYATIYGTGSCGTSFTAQRISLGTAGATATPMPAPNVSGTIANVGANTINISAGGSCGHVNVSYNTSTEIVLNGLTLSVGVYANVWGSGSCGTSFTATMISLSTSSTSPTATPTATPTPTPSPTPTPTPTLAPPAVVLKHVLTSDYCCGGYSNDTPAGGVATAKPWITYYGLPSANSDPTGTYPSYGTPGLAAAGISPSNVYAYVDDSRIRNGDFEYHNIAPGGADASAEAKTCSGTPLTFNNGQGYITDPYQPATLQVYDNDISTHYNYSTEYGAVFLDDIGSYLYADSGAVPCESGIAWSQPTISSVYATLIAAISLTGLGAHAPPTFILNTLSPLMIEANGSASLLASEIQALTSVSSVIGLDCEGCLADNTNAEIGLSTPNDIANQWLLAEDAAIAVVNNHKIFWLQDQDASSTGSASYAGRLYAFASFMLVWDPSYTVYQNDYYGYVGDGEHPNSSNPQIHVFPEEQLVAYNPIVSYPSTASGIGALKDSGGTYFREYQTCYFAGVAVGGCAFVVNPSNSSLPKPALQKTYSHTMTISSQSDVIDGGTVSLSGSSMPATIPALTGYVLLP